MKNDIIIQKIPDDEAPWDLLLFADPSREQIAAYLYPGECEVGTGNCGLMQLVFYQKAGFRLTGVVRDFFVSRYAEDVIENGNPCRDMVRLTLEL